MYPCVFYRKYPVIITYVDDCVILSYNQEMITSLMESLKNGPEGCALTDKADISNDLGVNIKKNMGREYYPNRTWRKKKSSMYALQYPLILNVMKF